MGAGCLSIVFLSIEMAAVEELQGSGGRYIQGIQEIRSGALDMFFIVVSKGSMYIASLIGFCLLSAQYCRVGSQCVFITYLSLWFGNLMKNLILHPRPYWANADIHPLSCPKDHGSPSGHAITVGATILFFHFHFYQRQRLASTTASSLLLALLAFDRNYLGVHFYFQVVLGYAFALSIVSVFKSEGVWKIIEKGFERKGELIWFQGVVLCLNLLGVFIGVFRGAEIKGEWKGNFERSCKGGFDGRVSLLGPAAEGTAICILGGMAQGLYLKGNWELGMWKERVAGVFIFAVGLIAEQVCEMYIKTLATPLKLTLLSVIRYLTGLYISFLIPAILSYWTRHPKPAAPNN